MKIETEHFLKTVEATVRFYTNFNKKPRNWRFGINFNHRKTTCLLGTHNYEKSHLRKFMFQLDDMFVYCGAPQDFYTRLYYVSRSLNGKVDKFFSKRNKNGLVLRKRDQSWSVYQQRKNRSTCHKPYSESIRGTRYGQLMLNTRTLHVCKSRLEILSRR